MGNESGSEGRYEVVEELFMQPVEAWRCQEERKLTVISQ